MKKEKIFAVSAGVTLAVTCVFSCFSSPTEVHADFGNFVGDVDYILSLSGSDAEFILTPGGAFVAGAIIGIYLCTQNPLLVGQSDLDASSITCISGYYYLGDDIHTCYSACSSLDASFSDGRVPVCIGTDFTATAVCTSSINKCIIDASSTDIWFRFGPYNLSSCWLNIDSNVFTSGDFQGYYYYDMHAFVPKFNLNSVPIYNNGDNIASRFTYNGYTIAKLAGSNTLPIGSIDFVDPMPYINNVLRPYVEINYPDYIFLLPDPDPEPTETLDPSETMPGLPVIQLPTVPPPDYDMELPEKMLEGAGFWFTALTEVLDELGWLAIVIALAVIAIVLYYVF